MTKRQVLITVIGCGWLTAAGAAHAQEVAPAGQAHAAVEITPFVSLHSGVTSGIGAAVRWPVCANLSVEWEMSQRYAELNALASSVSLLVDLPKIGVATPYLAGGVGVEQFGYATSTAGGSLVTHAGTTFSVNAGGGVRVPVDDTWGLRADMRWSNGIGSQAPERLRLYNGITFGKRD
jgi:opacity protein-like surface antigen